MRRICSVAVAMFLTSSMAMAEGFKGGEFYLGATGGVNSPSIDSHVNDNGTITSIDISKAGLLYGIHVGYRVSAQHGFHGVELSIKDSTAKGKYQIGSLGGGYKTEESIDLSYKGGYEIATNTHITGRLGYGWLNISHQISGSLFVQNGSFNHTLGYVLTGLGIEHRLNERVSITGEYLYRHAIEDAKKRHEYISFGPGHTDIKGEYSDHSFMIGINYFF